MNKKVPAFTESKHSFIKIQGCKLYTEVFTFSIMSRFPGLQIIAGLLLLVRCGTMEFPKSYSLLTVTGSLRTFT